MTYRTHPDYLALLRSVRATPDDDLPRKVSSDWLDENGHAERAAFIRLSVEVARVRRASPCHHQDPEHRPHCAGCRSLTSLFGRDSGADVPTTVACFVQPHRMERFLDDEPEGCHRVAALYERGFITVVASSFADWCRHAPTILPESVGLTVRLTTWPGVVRKVADGRLGFLLPSRDIDLPFSLAPVMPPDGDHSRTGRAVWVLSHFWPDVAAWELPPEDWPCTLPAERQFATHPAA